MGVQHRENKLGMTLVELLVSVAIVTTIFSAVVAMFLSAIRVTQKGTQSIQGFELARGVFNQIENDLTTAFSARDFGENQQFYGSPMGMTFVGVGQNVVSVDASGSNFNKAENAARASRLCRYTYVLWQEPVDAFQLVDRNDPGRSAARPQAVATYTLLRYIELGYGNLDDFRVPMPSVNANGEVNYADLRSVKDAAINEFGIGAVAQLFNRANCTDCGDMTDEQFERMQLREFWVRLLAGDPAMTGNGSISFWRDTTDAGANDPRPDRRDYIVAENIVLPDATFINHPDPTAVSTVRDIDGNGVIDQWDIYETGGFFQYGITRHNPLEGKGETLLRSYWQAAPNLGNYQNMNDWVKYNAVTYYTLDGSVTGDRLGSPQMSRIPEVVHVRVAFGMQSPFPGSPDFLPDPFEQTIEIPSGYIRPRFD